jgi:hypothetical protein
MSSIQAVPSFFTGRINSYVPAMKYAADMVIDGVTRISFGAPAVASATLIVNASSINAAVTKSALTYTADATYGRAVQMVLSGAGTPTVQVFGRDFWGQPMSETMTGNGTTPVLGKKAFKYIDSWSSTLVAATTINIGTQNIFGLPYKCVKVLSEEADGVIATIGTLTAPVLTDPQTATTGDPRGTYTPNTTPDGSKVLTIYALFDNSTNAAGNGGLMGIKQVSA